MSVTSVSYNYALGSRGRRGSQGIHCNVKRTTRLEGGSCSDVGRFGVAPLQPHCTIANTKVEAARAAHYTSVNLKRPLTSGLAVTVTAGPKTHEWQMLGIKRFGAF